MNKNIKTLILTVVISLSLCLGTNAAVKTVKPQASAPAEVQKTVTPPITKVYESVNPLDIVANPQKYLNKKVKIRAQFDKFSTLGLDYKPAFRSSEKYITFLIKRSDVQNHTVPLSELKNFLDRKIAEKFIDLKPGDEVEYTGIVFSNALSDAWIDVDTFTVLTPKPADNAVKKSTDKK